MQNLSINFNFTSKYEKLNKPWELCIGSCHAYTLLREDVRQHFKMLNKECGFQYIRCHGLFDDDMSVVVKEGGKFVYSFINIDSIYDYLLKNNMKPFIELSFMPAVLASDPTKTVFHYKGIVSLPKNMGEWNNFIKAFTTHLIERYGLEEVRKWYFEFWNEPNLGGDILNFNTGFFAGTQEQYFDFYKNTANTIKSVDSLLKVGGPASSNNNWIKEFISYCEANGAPIDFISTHHYPTDVIFGDNKDGTEEQKKFNKDIEECVKSGKNPAEHYSIENIWRFVERGTCYKMALKAKSECGKYPLCYTEWESLAGYRNENEFGASFDAKTVMDCRDIVSCYSYWTGSDIFEEEYQRSFEFYGGFGLVSFHGIKKAGFNVFKILHKLSGEISLDEFKKSTVDGYLVKNSNSIYVLLINHNSLSHDIDSFKGNVQIYEFGRDIHSITSFVVDQYHSNPFETYKNKYKFKQYLNDKEIQDLKRKGKLYSKEIKNYSISNNTLSFNYILKPYSVTMFEIK